jgi:hypothetical protein
MGQQQQQHQEIVAGSALRRIILVLTVAAVMATMMVAMAVPAMAANDKGQGEPGPPTASGSEGHTVVFHCTSIGEQGTSVINKESGGHGGCRT